MQENEAALEQEVGRQLQRVGSLQYQLQQVQAAADACQSAAAMREAELMAQIEEREAGLQAARVRCQTEAARQKTCSSQARSCLVADVSYKTANISLCFMI